VTLYATTLTSTTTASYSSGIAIGSSSVEGLYYEDDGTRVNLTVTGAPNQVITGIPGLLDVIVNQQTWDAGHDALTTNALDVQTALNSGVEIASSTAGYSGKTLTGAGAAPEPGSMPLIAAGVPLLFGGIHLRRRRNAARQA
jgi:hypothetical protein